VTAADLMLDAPKTLAADATVAEVREQFENPKVQMVLLCDGPAFVAAVTAIPAGAAPTDLARGYREEDPQTIAPDASAEEAFERAAASTNRRVIVVDEERNLLGLLCLNQSRTAFCRTPDT
jgi:CBS domain-containing protein